MALHFSATRLLKWLPCDILSRRNQTAQIFMVSSISERQVSVLTVSVDLSPELCESEALETCKILPAFHLQYKLAQHPP